ncbi:MAG: Holliday junction branch migration protein RuvA [Hyphomonadaceae bacterium]|nr:Holliday junction branch migration protein RuvA [Clostridia bacterium]
MYGYLKGTLEQVKDQSIIIEVAGVGYRVTVSAHTREKLPHMHQGLKLFTTFKVKEDAMELYGFFDEDEQAIFEMLLAVSGVGPKAALNILSVITPQKFPFIIATGDVKSITQAAGVGTKLAQRILLELKDKVKVADLTGLSMEDVQRVPDNEASEAVTALISLGYTYPEAMKAVSAVGDSAKTIEDIIKMALKKMM